MKPVLPPMPSVQLVARQTDPRLRPWLALAWLGLLALAALLAPLLPLPYAPATPDLAHFGTSPAVGWAAGHYLGTDPQGRDVLANLLFGARTVLLLTVPAAALAALLGALLGSLAGFWGRRLRVGWPWLLLAAGAGWWALALPGAGVGPGLGAAGVAGSLLARWRRGPGGRSGPIGQFALPLDAAVLALIAALGTVPRLLLVVAVAAGGGLALPGLLLLLALTSWPGAARLVRAETLRISALPYVAAGRALGLPEARLWWHHVLPAALRPLRTELPLSLAGLIALESTLSFLGLGLPPDVPSWGRLVGAARLDPSAWWTAAFPIGLLLLTTAALRAVARPR